MEADYKLVFALNSEERRNILKNKYPDGHEECLQGLKDWKSKKSIVKEEQFEWMLLANQISLKEFAAGIKRLNSDDITRLYSFTKKQGWYLIHKEILDCVEKDKQEDSMKGFQTFAAPYLKWIKNEITVFLDKSLIHVEKSCLSKCMEMALKEITEIAQKTLIYDHMEEFGGKDRRVNNFGGYINIRFGNKKGYIGFFNDYPVLARLLATRAEYIVNNFNELIMVLEKTKDEIAEKFGTTKELKLEDIKFHLGDSHNKGKTVFFLTVNEKKLIYKYKNLYIGNKLNEFYTVLEELDSCFSFYKIDRILYLNHTIEEYVVYEECEGKQEIADFYRRFGQMVMIAYILCGNDLHFENLISVKGYPVIVDVETFIQNESPLINNGSAARQYLLDMMDSILGSNLLPNALSCSKDRNEIEYSALTGDEQILPFKILRLIEDQSGCFRMEYQKCKMEGAENLPILNGKKIPYDNYVNDILNGFSQAYSVICKNQRYIIQAVKQLFSGVEVRNVLKGTQKYADMLNYAYHPSYMTNYLNREKLFENLWAYPHINPFIIKYEIEDLLVNDIPIFYNITDKRSILTSKRKIIPLFYQDTAVERVCNKINRCSKKDFDLQFNNLYLALGMYKGQLNNFLLEGAVKADNPIMRAKIIVDYLCTRLIWGKDKNSIRLPAYIVCQDKKWKYSVMTDSFYDGLSGVYILLMYFCKLYPSQEYKDILLIMENMFFSDIKDIEDFEQYVDYQSYLYIISCKLEYIFNLKDVGIGKKLLTKISQYYGKHKLSDEWLFGRASLIKICLKFYQVSGLRDSLEMACVLLYDIDIYKGNIKHIGFAHGYAGVIYSMACMIDFIDRGQIAIVKAKIMSMVKKMEALLDKNLKSMKLSWCKGIIGIGYVYLKLWSLADKELFSTSHMEKIINRIISESLKDTCICHGIYGKVSFLTDLLNSKYQGIDKKQICKVRSLICNNKDNSYILQGVNGEPDLGLLSGLSGIAYELLRCADSSIPNILVLD